MAMKLIWAGVIAFAVAVAGAGAVFAAQPTPRPHGKPSPSPSVQQVATPSPPPSETQSPAPSDTPKAATGNTSSGHPCNHGWYVSQAAHKHAGGAYVSSVAKSDLGKNGTCTAPLPPPPA